jgi:predicted ATPase/predicted Ser/Thr protein kinase
MFSPMSSMVGSQCLGEDVIAAFVAGGLNGREVERVDEHLATCADCLWLVTAAAVNTPRELALGFASVRAQQGGEVVTTSMLPERFERRHLLAEGGMGAVYYGLDRETGAAVAIKRLKPGLASSQPALLGRFQREADILRKLDHPNIVKMIASERDGDQHQIVMEYVGGGSLRQLLKSERRLPVARAIAIVLELTDALSRAHHLGVIHRDIKPENVLLGKNGTPKIGDFGLASMVDHDSSTSNAVLGTMAYLSPEALSGQAADARADLWALGVMLFEMVAGRRPFEAHSGAALAAAVLNQPTPDLEAICPEAPVEFVDLVYRLLEKDRNQRIGTARQVGAELEALTRGPSERLQLAETMPGRQTTRAASLTQRALIHLPAQTTPFVGRDAELAKLLQLVDDPAVRAITIIGPGGMGKSRLALELGRQIAGELARSGNLQAKPGGPRGVCFIDLAPLVSPELIIGAIAEAVGFQFNPSADPKRQLLDYLREKRLLLLLDNFEHLLAGGALVNELLQTAAGIKVLATSRERLGLCAEVQFTLAGMSLPDDPGDAEARNHSAIDLFVDSARRIKFGFRPSSTEIGEIVKICRLVHGMPLGIVLAASWIDTLSLDEIAGEIERSMDFLHSDAGDLPSRQQSIRAVFDHSWGLLSTEERTALACVSVFRGGFTRAAAEAVGHASLRTLAALVAKSLIRRVPETSRYEIHELLRQYAASKLRLTPGEHVAAMERMAEHYSSFLGERAAHIVGPRRRIAAQDVNGEIDNIRVAVDWMLEHRQAERLCESLQTLGVFYHSRRSRLETERVFGAIANAFAPNELLSSHPAQKAFGVALVYQAMACEELGRKREGLELMSRAVAALAGTEHESARALASTMYAVVGSGLVEPTQLVASVEHGIALYRKLGDDWSLIRALSVACKVYVRSVGDLGKAEAAMREAIALQRLLAAGSIVFPESLAGLGQVRYSRGHRREGCELVLESLKLAENADDAWATLLALQFAARAHRELGDYPAAEALARRCLVRARELGSMETVAWSQLTLGSILREESRLDEATEAYSAGAEHSGGDPAVVAKSELGLGEVALDRRSFRQAERHLARSLSLCEAGRQLGGACEAFEALGYLAFEEGLTELARDHFRRALELARGRDRPAELIGVAVGAAWLCARSGQTLRAVELASLADHHPATGEPLRARRIAPLLEQLQSELTTQDFEAARVRGQGARLDAVFGATFP